MNPDMGAQTPIEETEQRLLPAPARGIVVAAAMTAAAATLLAVAFATGWVAPAPAGAPGRRPRERGRGGHARRRGDAARRGVRHRLAGPGARGRPRQRHCQASAVAG